MGLHNIDLTHISRMQHIKAGIDAEYFCIGSGFFQFSTRPTTRKLMLGVMSLGWYASFCEIRTTCG